MSCVASRSHRATHKWLRHRQRFVSRAPTQYAVAELWITVAHALDQKLLCEQTDLRRHGRIEVEQMGHAIYSLASTLRTDIMTLAVAWIAAQARLELRL